jgi:hypothetical protein
MAPRSTRSIGMLSLALVVVLAGTTGPASAAPARTSTDVVLGAPASVPESIFTVAAPSVVATPAVPNGTTSPARYDKVSVRRFGPPTATHVLVLVPGTNGGAGDFDIVAPYLVTHVPHLQVWAEMRREGALQDDSVIRSVLAGKATYTEAFDYYLGFLSDPSITDHYQPLQASQFGFVQQWGMAVAMNDLNAVIQKARKGGSRTVTLGGHSLGGTEAAAYAAWDFHGRGGYRNINGVMCIDGCAGAPFAGQMPVTVASAQAAIAQMDTTGPWLDLLGVGLPWVTGAFSQVGALAAVEAPNAPSLLQTFPLLPTAFKPPKPVTNQAQLGYAFDASTSPASLALIHVHSGHVALTGDPAGWVDLGLTPIQNVADVFAESPLAAADWYYPKRLSIDAGAAATLSETPAATYLGLRLLDTGKVNVPLYAFQTSLGGTDNAVANGARYFQQHSKIPSVTVVSRTATYSHLDPLLATPSKNAFLRTAIRWLRRIGA